MFELLENCSVPERTLDLKALGQLEDIDSPQSQPFLCQHGVILILLLATVLELLENHSVPERTINLEAHGQLEGIDSPNLNHFWFHLDFI